MKKSMLVAAMVLGLAGLSFAQSSVSPQITIGANIVSALTVTTKSNMTFGNVGAGTGAVTLNPQALASGQTAGSFVVNGNLATPVTVTYSAPADLSDGSGHTVAWTATNLIGFNQGTVGSATGVASNTQVTLDATSGNYYFWLGGSINVINGQTPGNYTTTFTLNVAY